MSNDAVMFTVIFGGIFAYLMIGGVVGFLVDHYLDTGEGESVPAGILWPGIVLAFVMIGPVYGVARFLRRRVGRTPAMAGMPEPDPRRPDPGERGIA